MKYKLLFAYIRNIKSVFGVDSSFESRVANS